MTTTFDSQLVHECAFGIVDAAMVDHLPAGLCVDPLIPKRLTQSGHLMPALIDLRRTPADRLNVLAAQVDESRRCGEPPLITIFIKTDAGTTETARHWNAMQIAEPQRGWKVWLRLHDPRVLHQMLRVLEPLQRQNLFGLSQTFIYWVGGEWITAIRELGPKPSSHDQENSKVALYAGPAKWDWNRIERIGLVNRALLGTGINETSVLTRQSALAEQLIQRAVMRHTLSEPVDLVEFAVRGLQSIPVFDECHEVAHAIRIDTNSVERSNLADRFALINEQVWDSLRRPINSSGDAR